MAQVRIVEVGPRDGLQNISQHVPTETKVELIQRLQDAGLKTIEVTSVVAPRAVPQLKDCREVLRNSRIQELLRDRSRQSPVLVPNIKGLEIAHSHGVSEVAIFISATEGFSKANIHCTVEEGFRRARTVASEAKKRGLLVRGYVSCVFADPFDGPTPASSVLRAVQELLDMGCYEISLGDTLGVGSPSDVRSLVRYLTGNKVLVSQLAGHFHDTYGQALANVWEAYACGIRVFDSSVAGLGGCPFAPGAKGNLASEDLVYMFDRAGVKTGVNLAKLVDTGHWVSRKLSKPTSSRAGAALLAKSQAEVVPKVQPYSPHAIAWKLEKQPDGLLIDRAGANLRITMDRPKNGNALTTNMIHELVSIFLTAEKDSTVNRIIITGRGKFFCTGMDLARGTSPVAVDKTSTDAQYNRLRTLFEAIDQSSKVTISCLNGPAFGGGVGLAFACDLRLFTKNADVTLSEAKLGLCPATISKYIVREWGIPFSREAMLSARPVSPAELKAKGIIMETAEDQDQLECLLGSLLDRLRRVSPDASRMCKELVSVSWSAGGQSRQEEVIKGLFDEMMTPNGSASYGLREFQAGRKVDWDRYKADKVESKL